MRQDTGKLRYDPGQQKEGHGERDNQHDRRVGQRAFKLAAERRLFFLIVGDTLQNTVQVTRRFPGPNQIDVQAVKDVGVFGERLGERQTGLDLFADFLQRVL